MQNNPKIRVHIDIKGIVQGVGFRPFVYNLAKSFHLTGFVLNDTRGVTIEVEGEKEIIESFIMRIKLQPPPQAEIFEIKDYSAEPIGYEDFKIRDSEDTEEKFVPISPELATCSDCCNELFDPKDRRYRYPFINCTNCGPRFTIVKDIPYDRKKTTMSVFPMCEQCRSEYEDPTNRRFHAQPNACPVCGPRLFLLDKNGSEMQTTDVVREACRLLKEGKILSIKGLGGYHLACDALNKKAVSELRSRKYREHKPFALMVKDLETANKICFVNDKEAAALVGPKRPVVLLQKKLDSAVAEDVAPLQKCHGVMLPYTPLHHLILSESGLILVMTSGNISSEPIAFKDINALEQLHDIADYYVVHNREIHTRTDDSVIRIWDNEETVLRRSRGYVPYPLLMQFEFSDRILACGGELKNTFCLTRGNYAFLSHHIGDLENLETLAAFEDGIEHFKRIFNLSPTLIAYDLHPEYLSTKYALSLPNIRTMGVQHHHAHIVSCMGENKLEGEVIGVAFDGTGFGLDGKIWGGEFFVSSYHGFQRIAHFKYLPLPGGEKAIKEPWRMAAAFLYSIYGDEMLGLDIEFIKSLDPGNWKTIKQMVAKGINSPLTSSAGRLFDAISALLGVRKEIDYEGQAAIELEMRSRDDVEEKYRFFFHESGESIEIDLEFLGKEIVADLLNRVDIEVISSRFHNTMAHIILEMCNYIRNQKGLDSVVLSGGVFQNSFLRNKAVMVLQKGGFRVYTHHRVPPNDGGISLGQAIIANEWIKRGQSSYVQP
jgi:hydrogenase maturation protein HypF